MAQEKKKAQGKKEAKAPKQEAKAPKKAAKAPKKAAASTEQATPPRLRAKYKEEVVGALMKHFDYKSVMQVPRLQKIVVNMGVGEAISNSKILKPAAPVTKTVI